MNEFSVIKKVTIINRTPHKAEKEKWCDIEINPGKITFNKNTSYRGSKLYYAICGENDQAINFLEPRNFKMGSVCIMDEDVLTILDGLNKGLSVIDCSKKTFENPIKKENDIITEMINAGLAAQGDGGVDCEAARNQVKRWIGHVCLEMQKGLESTTKISRQKLTEWDRK